MHRFFRRALVALLLSIGVAGQAALPPEAPDGAPLPTLAPMIRSVSPAVVNIATYTTVRQYVNPLLNDPFFRNFFNIPPDAAKGAPQRRTQSAGSGVIVDAANGYVLTNAHVVDHANEIEVGLVDGRTLKAKLVGVDRRVDVAVLRVEADKLAEIRIGKASNLQVGDFVVAIGNPFGLGQTVTSGIVSALGRSGLGIEGYEDFIQTDASINPGNSGGALVNLRGELVGINTAIIAPGGGNIGIGFAIPSDMAMSIMKQLVEHGEVRRGVLGISTQDLTPELAKAFGMDEPRGALVTDVDPQGPAARAGLRAGDVVVTVDGQPVKRGADLRNRVGIVPVGTTLVLGYLRDGKSATARVVLTAPVLATADGGKLSRWLDGAKLRDATDEGRAGVGVEILSVAPDSTAARAGLRAGDVIVAANRANVADVGGLGRVLASGARQVQLQVQRDGGTWFLLLR